MQDVSPTEGNENMKMETSRLPSRLYRKLKRDWFPAGRIQHQGMPTLKHWLCLHHIRTSQIPHENKSTARTQTKQKVRKSHSNGYKWERGINSHLSSQLSPTFNINIINTCPTLLVWQVPAVYCDPSSEQSIERPHNGKTFHDHC